MSPALGLRSPAAALRCCAWGGRPVHRVQAQGILVGALNVLAVHYGLMPRAQAAWAEQNPATTERIDPETGEITTA
ncbi:MAG: hypothetical protein NT133_01335 [Alphaproteobacteria bacterium]|nr:hypothetical protein [Alphaproteobacteria bacterium]